MRIPRADALGMTVLLASPNKISCTAVTAVTPFRAPKTHPWYHNSGFDRHNTDPGAIRCPRRPIDQYMALLVETPMNRRIFALALAATAVACKEQPRKNADGTPALSYAGQDSLIRQKD